MGLYMVESIDANMLIFVIRDILCRFSLTMSYEGCAVMDLTVSAGVL